MPTRGISDKTAKSSRVLTVKESTVSFILAAILFSSWGFTGGITDVLLKRFQDALHITKLQSTGMSIAFYAAYAICPMTISNWLIQRYGYRLTFVSGLCGYAIGCILFWPSGHKRSFGGFCGSNFVLASGLATLETALIPFLSVCGPPKWAELRTILATAIQSVSHVVALIFASYIIFRSDEKRVDAASISLTSIQWIYLGIGCFMALLAIAFYFAPIIEITDEDLEELRKETLNDRESQPLSRQHTLFWGLFAGFAWTGTQSGVSAFFINFVTDIKPGATAKFAAQRMAIAHGAFTAGRFTTCLLMLRFKSRVILLYTMIAVIVFLAAAIGTTGDLGIAMMIVEFFLKSSIFPIMFALSLKGLGRHTKKGASLMISTVASGVLAVPAMGAIAVSSNTRIAMVIPLAGALLAISFPLYVNIIKASEIDNYNKIVKVAKGHECQGQDHERGNHTIKERELTPSAEVSAEPNHTVNKAS